MVDRETAKTPSFTSKNGSFRKHHRQHSQFPPTNENESFSGYAEGDSSQVVISEDDQLILLEQMNPNCLE